MQVIIVEYETRGIPIYKDEEGNETTYVTGYRDIHRGITIVSNEEALDQFDDPEYYAEVRLALKLDAEDAKQLADLINKTLEARNADSSCM